jgi:hypothetical protein
MIVNVRYCPHCNAELDADTEIFVQGGEVIGCENCVRQTWADYEDDEDEEGYADYCDMLNDFEREERVFG